MLGPVRDGGTIIANTAPGCWGPMITPRLHGGHEVTEPVAVEGAEPGDAVVIRIRDITVTSMATASGHDEFVDGHFLGDPYVAARNPKTGVLRPETRVEGLGQDAVRDVETGDPVTPFRMVHGYTLLFDEGREVGITVDGDTARILGREAERWAALPDASVQHSILVWAPHDLVGVPVRLRPFLGQLGTTPSRPFPDSHNAGDFGSALIDAPHEYGITAEELIHRTDGHMDIDAVREGVIVVAPVRVRGAGIYMGDMHALQGDGEIAGHTADVSGSVTLEVGVLKGLTVEGPILFPLAEDLPPLARPLTAREQARAETLAASRGIQLEVLAPISVVGTGPDLNAATENGLRRAAELLDMSVAEVRNRATITGGIEIGRNPGVIQVTFLAPLARLDRVGLGDLAREQYGLQ
ncbi:MAG: acetamidase/formamidase family protein [Gemmatimonadales bacterium]|nr:MAG: acetamidase/formamidase family protein [Gemmatimonadales bacterium]